MSELHNKDSLSQFIANLPKKSGVYLMKDAAGTVIYVGKAKDLRSRVRSYFNLSDGRFQIKFLIKRVEKIETILTGTEEQALLLERDLINRFKPRYNIRLKDDKSYLSIRVDPNEQWPKIDVVRRPKRIDNARYFGPFTHSYQTKEILELIKNTLPLRTCSDTVFNNRTRPCLEYQIKRCLGPCCLPVDTEEYDQLVKEAINILNGKTDQLAKMLDSKMDNASSQLDFEKAAIYRDRIEFLEKFKSGQKYVATNADDRDVFVLYRETSLATLAIMQVRNGKIVYNKNYSFEFVEVGDDAVMQSALEDYYQKANEVPDEIVVNILPEDTEVLQDYLKSKCGRKITIHQPQQGLKQRLVGLAQLNAERHFELKFKSDEQYTKMMQELKTMCGLSQMPRRIECIDISNLQGSNIVGAVVSFYDGKPDKSRYRKYKISFSDTSTSAPNDFAAIGEVVSRHLKRASENADFCDLLIIDGGQIQLDYAAKAMNDLALNIDLIAIAKDRLNESQKSKQLVKRERVFTLTKDEPVSLDPLKPLTKFVAGVRDEVHRFVISFHRDQRKKRLAQSALDAIAGIGVSRRIKLMQEFGSLEAISKTSAAELAKRGRFSKVLAQNILDALQKDKLESKEQKF